MVGLWERRQAQGLALSGGFTHHLQISAESLRPGSPTTSLRLFMRLKATTAFFAHCVGSGFNFYFCCTNELLIKAALDWFPLFMTHFPGMPFTTFCRMSYV